MKKNLFKRRLVATVSILCCATFLISLQYSNSSQGYLIKDNIDAISDSGDDDPGQKLKFVTCAKKTHRQPDDEVIACQEGGNIGMTYPCIIESDKAADQRWGTGTCYMVPTDD